jgi:membrane protease subunit (stomatin/prohibitin family)
MAIVDRIKWDGDANLLAWKFPSQEIATWSHLIVNETQDAFLVVNGVYEGPFVAGNHELITENLPLVRTLIGIPYGGKSPFSAEVWYVNKVVALDVKWGTSSPIDLIDPQFQVALKIRAFGQMALRVENSKKLLTALVGTMTSFDADTVADYMRSNINSSIKVAIAEAIISRKISIFDVSLHLEKISQQVRLRIAQEFSKYGLSLDDFNISSINFPDADPGMVQLKAALSKRAEMNVVGYTFQQEREFDVMEAVAGSPAGGAAAALGVGLGVGAAAPVGAALNNTFMKLNGEKIVSSGNTSHATSPASEQIEKSTLNSPPLALSEKINLLKQLAELRDAGILDDEEFATEKRKILDD